MPARRAFHHIREGAGGTCELRLRFPFAGGWQLLCATDTQNVLLNVKPGGTGEVRTMLLLGNDAHCHCQDAAQTCSFVSRLCIIN